MRLSRRKITRLLAGAPVAAAAALLPRGTLLGALDQPATGSQAAPQATPAQADESPLGRFLAREEAELTSEEKRRVRKQVAALEQSLKEVRAFALGNDVPPAGTFRPLRSAPARRAR